MKWSEWESLRVTEGVSYGAEVPLYQQTIKADLDKILNLTFSQTPQLFTVAF